MDLPEELQAIIGKYASPKVTLCAKINARIAVNFMYHLLNRSEEEEDGSFGFDIRERESNIDVKTHEINIKIDTWIHIGKLMIPIKKLEVGTYLHVNFERDRSDYLISEFSDNNLKKIESETNDFITKNEPISHKFSEKVPLLKVWKSGPIEEFCGGTHPKNSNEIGKIILIKKNKGKGKIRIITTLENPD